MKNNYWVWTRLTELLNPDRKAGDPVPLGYLSEGDKEYFPYGSWVKKGYIEMIIKNENL